MNNRRPNWYKKANPETEAFTGRNAKKGPPNRKMAARLERRMRDYSLMMSDSNDRTGRKGSGGYHRPGSNH